MCIESKTCRFDAQKPLDRYFMLSGIIAGFIFFNRCYCYYFFFCSDTQARVDFEALDHLSKLHVANASIQSFYDTNKDQLCTLLYIQNICVFL